MTTKPLQNSYAHVRQTFCEKNFVINSREIRWFDLVCLVQIDKNRLARIELRDIGTVDSFNCFVVKILHTTNGEIDYKTFRFIDYLDEREDTRTDLPDQTPYVWANGGKFDWYIAKPSLAARASLMGAIVNYIRAFE